MIEELHNAELNMLKKLIDLFDRHGLKYTAYCGTLLGAVRHKGFIPWDDDIDLAMPLSDYRKLLKLSDELEPDYSMVHYYNSKHTYHNWIRVCDNNTAFMKKEEAMYPGNYGVTIDVYPFIGAFSGSIGQKFQNGLLKISYVMRRADKSGLSAKAWKSKLLRALSICPFPIRNAIAKLCLKMAFLDPERHKKISTVDAAPFRAKYDADDWKEMTELEFEDIKLSAPVNYDKILRIMYGDYMQLPPEYLRYARFGDDMIIDLHRSYKEYLKCTTT